MGVKGLQSFMERCCPEVCVAVDLRELAKQHASAHNQTFPALVVDGMACLRHWYSCKCWVSGGQWKEYMDILKSWVEAFSAAGIRLVFFFDGVVEERKRMSWIKRRHRVNGDVCKIFTHIKAYGEQPGEQMFVLPSGLATFTRFALKSLGQEVFCSTREADYEICSYAREHNCMGILGQDTDFIIFDSAPYLSSAKLNIDTLTTMLYDRKRLCHCLGLEVFHLPLLACLLGNDVVSEERMQHVRKEALAKYRQNNYPPYSGSEQGQIIFGVSQLVRTYSESCEDIIPPFLKMNPEYKELLENGIQSYLLCEQTKHLSHDTTDHPAAVYQKYVSPAILQACREKHVAAEGFMVYSVVSEGVVECSNSLEDEAETELLPQALVYKPCRQRMYGVLLMQDFNDVDVCPPPIKEWFVYPRKHLKEPEMVPPVRLNIQYDHPGLDMLWFGKNKDVSTLRRACFLAILDLSEFTELYEMTEEHLFVTLCLVTYIVLQVKTLSQEDVDAYLSQAVCLAQKSPQELQQIKLPFLSSRSIQLGCLYVRGLSYLLGANCASGGALSFAALMPWNSFDGQLFQSKYLLAHSGVEDMGFSLLLDNDASCLNVFHHLRNKVQEVCLMRGRALLSSPRRHTVQSAEVERHMGDDAVGHQSEQRGLYHSAARWNGRGEAKRREHTFGNSYRGRHGVYPSTSYPPDSHSQQYRDRGVPTNRINSRGRFKSRYRLAARWSRPPAP